MESNQTLNNSAIPDKLTVKREICLLIPPQITSPGLAPALESKENYMQYAGPRLHLQMVIFFVLTQAIHKVLKYMGLPIFVSQAVAGILMSPMFLDKNKMLIAMSVDSIEVLGTLASLGFMFFIFLSGVKMNVSMIFKFGWKAICIGILNVVAPLLVCLIYNYIALGESYLITRKSAFLAITYSATSFPVIYTLVVELKVMNSQLGRLGLSAALVSDILSLILLNICQYLKLAKDNEKTSEIWRQVGLNIAYIFLVMVVLRAAMKWMVKLTPVGGKIKEIFFYIVVLTFMITPFLTNLFEVFILFGPFFMGLAVPDGPPLGSALVEKLEPLVSGFFLPIFVITCGMRIDLSNVEDKMPAFRSIEQHSFAVQQLAFAAVALIIKFGTCLVLPLMLFKMSFRDALAFAFILISKGVIEMGNYATLNDTQVISDELFNIMAIFVIVIASIVPIIVRRLYDPSKKYLCHQERGIMHTRPYEQLRIIGCIHVPSNVYSIINILNFSSPTKENPMSIDVLHLVKSHGQATPLFIAHQKQGQILSTGSYSENVILAFNQFEKENWPAATVNVFTAVSLPNFMYEDICNLAMDRHTSFIILPFHRRWYINGNLEAEDETIRSLNCEILEKAPCSIGILVERQWHLKRRNSRDNDNVSPDNSPSFSIAMIFLGGKDDREALALAGRMSLDRSISLTIIHLKDSNSLGSILGDDETADDMMLKTYSDNEYVTFIEEQVNSGSETAVYLRSIVNDYQLIIVGRRFNYEDPQTAGLQEWCEFSEIGIIGDLLSSSDFGGHYSVLVVQHQQDHQRISTS